MRDQQFPDLWQDTCKALGLDGARKLEDSGAAVEVDGVWMSVNFDERDAGDRWFLYVDIGSVEDRYRKDAYADLMTMNYMVAFETSGSYGIDPDTGNLVYVARFDMEPGFGAKKLAELLRGHATHAQALRKTILVGKPPSVLDRAPSDRSVKGQ